MHFKTNREVAATIMLHLKNVSPENLGSDQVLKRDIIISSMGFSRES